VNALYNSTNTRDGKASNIISLSLKSSHENPTDLYHHRSGLLHVSLGLNRKAGHELQQAAAAAPDTVVDGIVQYGNNASMKPSYHQAVVRGGSFFGI
jgi:hypothetical protein